jgi:hypothetical protein
MKTTTLLILIALIVGFSPLNGQPVNGEKIRAEILAKSKVSTRELPKQQKKATIFNLKPGFQSSSNRQALPPIDDPELKYTLDSIYLYSPGESWTAFYKDLFHYNQAGRILTHGGWDIDKETGEAKLADQFTTTYDDQGRIIEEKGETRSRNTGQVYIQWKNIYTFDDAGNLIRDESYNSDWVEDNQAYKLNGNRRYDFIFDDNNQEIASINYNWNYDDDEWIPESKFEYSYQNDMEVMFAGYMWDADKQIWIGHFKFERELVEEINQFGSTYYHWDYEKDHWYIQSRDEYSVAFDDDGIVITYIQHEYDYEASSVFPAFKMVSSKPISTEYSSLNHFSLTESYQWHRDEEIWINYEKTENSFNDDHLLVETHQFSWNEDPQTAEYEWRLSLHATSTFSEGKITESLSKTYHYDYSDHTNKINRQNKATYTYDTSGILTEEVFQYWEASDPIWKNNSKNTYTYYTDGNLETMTQYESYSIELSKWIPSRKYDYYYNPDDTSAGRTGYVWKDTNEDWKMTFKEEHFIDEKGREILNSRIYYIEHMDVYVTTHKKETRYDENDNIILDLYLYEYYYWNGQENVLDADGEKRVYTYDAQNRNTEIIEYNYSIELKEFVKDEKMVFTYDNTYTTALIKEENYLFESETEEWILNHIGELVVNFDIPLSRLHLPFQGDIEEVNRYFQYMPLELVSSEWDDEASMMIPYEKAVLFYSQRAYTSFSVPTDKTLMVFPNPSSDYIIVNTDAAVQIELIDLQGRSVLSQLVIDGQSIDISHLDAGLYLYRILSNNKLISGKLLKQ